MQARASAASDREGDPAASTTVIRAACCVVRPSERQAITVARSVIPHAGDARLLGVAPEGATAGAGLDLVLTADNLLAAWPTG